MIGVVPFPRRSERCVPARPPTASTLEATRTRDQRPRPRKFTRFPLTRSTPRGVLPPDELNKRVVAARRAYMAGLTLKSLQARRARKSAAS